MEHVSSWEERYPNFTKSEVSCPLSGEMKVTDHAMGALQALRSLLGKPLIINSGYRSPEYNRRVRGAPRSKHVEGTAFDISTRNHDRYELYATARDVGFKGFGFYSTFLHVDLGPLRSWGKW